MARTYRTKQATVVTNQRVADTTCDGCGKAIDPAGEEPDYANELFMFLNDGQCVSQRFRRDYCTACLTGRWQRICSIIGADPDDVSSSDFDDD